MNSFTVYLDDDKLSPDVFMEAVDRITRKISGHYPTIESPWSACEGISFKTPNIISIQAAYLKSTGDLDELIGVIDIINIDAHRLGKRLEIIVSYLDEPPHISYLYKFLNEFKKIWPKSFTQIKKPDESIEKRILNNEKPKNKRGPQNYSLEERIAAIKDWEKIDRFIYPTKLEEFLEARFGTSNGILNVKRSTFYSWRSRLREKGYL
jgi:hypothetical protein